MPSGRALPPMPRTPLSFLAVSCLAATLLPAQHGATADATAVAAAPLPFPTDRVLTDAPGEGVVTAATAGWKAQFDRDGATFVPFRGSALPSAPTTFRLASATVGGEALRLGDAVPELTGQRVVFARGAVAETWDLRQDGLEQAFELRELPARGELALHLAVGTALSPVRDGGGWRLVDERGIEVVHYGAAVAIDAAGRRCEVAEHWGARGLDLVVPAAFVAEATLPLVVDPLVAAVVTITPSVAEVGHPSIAYDGSLDEYAVVYEASFSATDHDVYLLRYNASLAYLGMLTIDNTVSFWGGPDVAVVDSVDCAYVVAEKSTGNVSPFSVAVRAVRLGASPFAYVPATFSAVGIDRRHPVVGGDPNPTGGIACVIACDHEEPAANDYHVDVFSFAGTNAFGVVHEITVAGQRCSGARIGKSCGDETGGDAAWPIVFRSVIVGQNIGAVRAASFERSTYGLRSYQGQPAFVVATPTQNLGSELAVSSPTDHAAGRRFLVVERRLNVITAKGALVGHVATTGGTVQIAAAPLLPGNPDHRDPAVDCDGARFLVTSTTRLDATDSDVYPSTFGIVGGQLVSQDEDFVSFSTDYDGQPAVCAARGSSHGNYGLAWTHGSVATADMRIQLQRYRGIAATGGFSGRATGCGNLVTTLSGSPWIGETFSATLSNAAGFPGFVFGTPASLPVGVCPVCTQGVVGNAIFGQQIHVTVPPDASFVGLTLSLQGFRFDLGGLPCLGQIELGNTVDFTVQ